MTEKSKEIKEKNKGLPILANGRGLALRSMDDMWRFACAVRDSGLAPSSFQKSEQILIALQSGAELGLPPMRSLQSFCVVKGQARLWGDAPLALVRQSGLMEYIKEEITGEGNEMFASCESKRKDSPNPVITYFSVEDAKQAGLWGKAGTWQSYPKRMLKYRARSFNLRDNFPDAFGGASIAEEYEGVEMPAEAPTPDAGSREDRKQVDAIIKDTQQTINEELEKVSERFITFLESPVALGRDVKAVPFAVLNEVFAKYATLAVGAGIDFQNNANFTLDDITKISAYLETNGIPDEILSLIPLPAEEQLKQAEETARDKLTDYDWQCNSETCGEKFNKPARSGAKGKGHKICPKCFTTNISETKPAKVEK